jgi:hypothetical protein
MILCHTSSVFDTGDVVMARTRKSYFEPWQSRRSSVWESGFGTEPPPCPEDWPEEDKRQWVQDWHAKRAKCKADAECIVWGSGMAAPALTVSLLGKPVVFDDQRIICTVRPSKAWPAEGPGHEEVAKRLAACVSAMAGVADPIKFMSDARALLKDLALSDSADFRALSLLARCIPPEQLETDNEEE